MNPLFKIRLVSVPYLFAYYGFYRDWVISILNAIIQ